MATATIKRKKTFPTTGAKHHFDHFDTLGRQYEVSAKVADDQIEAAEQDKVALVNERNAIDPNKVPDHAEQVAALNSEIADADSTLADRRKQRTAIPRSQADKILTFVARPDVAAQHWRDLSVTDFDNGKSADDCETAVQTILQKFGKINELWRPESEWIPELTSWWKAMKAEGAIDLAGLISPAAIPPELPTDLKTANVVTPTNPATGQMVPLALDFGVTLRVTPAVAIMAALDDDDNGLKALIRQGKALAAGKPSMSAEEKAAELARLDAELLVAWRTYEAATRREESQHVSRKRLPGVPPEVLLWIEKDEDWLK